MQIDITAVGTIIGMAVPIFGAVFWFGRLEGRVSELDREQTEMKEKIEKQEDKIEKQSERFNDLSKEMTKVSTGVETLQEQNSTLFNKIDKLTETMLRHITQKD